MSFSNTKFPSIKDGNYHFSEKAVSSHSVAPVESSSSCSTYSLYQSLYPSLDSITTTRQSITQFGASINPYASANMMNYPIIHPYLLESMHHNDHLHGALKQQLNPRLFSLPGQVENYLDMGPHPRRKNATRETTSILKAWLNEHQKNPYPTKGEKIMLAVITKMTLTQVSTWFANARRRLKKENKMTWSPNHKSDDEMDDIDDTDSSEILNNVSQEINAKGFILNLPEIREESRPSITEKVVDNSKSKIWSIADITSENKDHDNSKNFLSSNSHADSVTSPLVHSQPLLHSPTMQYLLWKHKELYQLHFSNILSNIHKYRNPAEMKNRMSEEDSKSQVNLYSDVHH